MGGGQMAVAILDQMQELDQEITVTRSVAEQDLDVGERLVSALVDERLIACGNIVPGVVSVYRWQGAVERDAEVLLVLKTTEAAVQKLLERVPELHPYDVPEVLVLAVEKGTKSYLAWVNAETEPAGDVGR